MRWLLCSIFVFAVGAIAASSAGPEDVVCGDIDGSGLVNISDFIYFDSYLWQDGPAPMDMWAANCGGCTGVNVYDFGRFIASIIAGGPLRQCNLDTACTPLYYGAVSLDSATGLLSPDTILTGCKPRFNIRVTNNTTWKLFAMANGFRVYSPDGAVWNSTELLLTDEFPTDWTPRHGDHFERVYTRHFSTDGSGADTVGLGAYGIYYGMVEGYDAVGLVIEIGPIPMESVGRTICLDSSWYPPAGEWIWYHWSVATRPPSTPTWDGQHCFTVAACCEHRGDLTLSGGVNVSDLTYLIAYLFQGGPGPGCFDAGDVNGDLSGPNISDLTYLVAYLFQGGTPPPPCP